MSNETKWTPGPWVVKDNGSYFEIRQNTPGGGEIAQACPSACWFDDCRHFEGGVAYANAHLIAAAPDGYALAELVMSICGNPKGVSEAGQEELYEAALQYAKKARGEQP